MEVHTGGNSTPAGYGFSVDKLQFWIKKIQNIDI